MPSKQRLADFVAAVVGGDHVGAIRDFYAEHATMQENLSEPRRGRDLLMAHETAALARVQKVVTHQPKTVVHDSDKVVIHWVFDFTGKDGVTRRIEELALQHWEGDRIVAEQFFYDTKTVWSVV